MDTKEIIELDQTLIDDGNSLLKILDGTPLKPSSFFWIYSSDSKNWRLVVSSRYFFEKNLKDSYSDLIDKIGEVDFVRLGIGDIALVPDNDALVNLLKVAIRTPQNAVASIKFKANVINGVLVEDAYIYRLS